MFSNLHLLVHLALFINRFSDDCQFRHTYVECVTEWGLCGVQDSVLMAENNFTLPTCFFSLSLILFPACEARKQKESPNDQTSTPAMNGTVAERVYTPFIVC